MEVVRCAIELDRSSRQASSMGHPDFRDSQWPCFCSNLSALSACYRCYSSNARMMHQVGSLGMTRGGRDTDREVARQ